MKGIYNIFEKKLRMKIIHEMIEKMEEEYNFLSHMIEFEDEEEDKPEVDVDYIIESDFLRALFYNGDEETYKCVKININPNYLKKKVIRKIYESYLLTEIEKRDVLSIALKVDDSNCQGVISDILKFRINLSKKKEWIFEAMERILERNWNDEREEIRRKIQSGQGSDEEAMKLIHHFNNLKKVKPKIYMLEDDK